MTSLKRISHQKGGSTITTDATIKRLCHSNIGVITYQLVIIPTPQCQSRVQFDTQRGREWTGTWKSSPRNNTIIHIVVFMFEPTIFSPFCYIPYHIQVRY